jgi:hypothetical protein
VEILSTIVGSFFAMTGHLDKREESMRTVAGPLCSSSKIVERACHKLQQIDPFAVQVYSLWPHDTRPSISYLVLAVHPHRFRCPNSEGNGTWLFESQSFGCQSRHSGPLLHCHTIRQNGDEPSCASFDSI